jgi:nucleotide-binding universal stress UspA family protein
MRILVGVSEGETQDVTLALASQLAQIETAQVTVVHVHAKEAKTDAEVLLARAREQLAGTPVEVRLVQGSSPAEALHELARAEDADVIVIGACRKKHALRGGDGCRIARGAPCPVAVAPLHHAGGGIPRRIGVAYDGREQSRAALAWAGGMARRLDGELHILSVIEPLAAAIDPVAGGVATDGMIDEVRRSREADLQDAIASVPEGVPASGVLLEGPVAPALLHAVGDLDLLVAGSPSHGPIGQVLTGSISRKLMDESPIPVALVPRSVIDAETVAPAA